MELVQGPSLGDQIEKEGALPEKAVVRLGSQLARGLQAAHEKGIVHRDLKPSNLQLTEDGLLKILDFGLARLLPGEPGPGEETAATQTALGKVAGTLLYMSPEQLRGRGVDERTDVYSAGAVLYEMATGKRLFSKPSAAELTEAILNEDPRPPRDINDRISPRLEGVILKALDKDPELRHQTAKDLRADLERLQQRSGSQAQATPPVARRSAEAQEAPGRRPSRNRERILWGGLALLLAGLAAFLARGTPPSPPELPPVVRFDVDIPDKLAHRGIQFAVSPDGQHVAMASSGDWERIWLRSLATPGARPLPGTDGGHMPFWSPDATALAFFVRSDQGELTLRRVSLESDEARAICTISRGSWSGGTWNEAGHILFSVGEWRKSATVYSVPADGGEPRVLLEPDLARQEHAVQAPQFLPDGRRFLFHVRSEDPASHGLWISSLDRPDERELVLAGVSYGTWGYVPSGRLVYSRVDSPSQILTQGFDAARARLRGEPVTISSGVDTCQVGGSVLACEEASGPPLELVWFARDGARLGTLGRPGNYAQVQLSPDDRRAAVSTGGKEISLLDVGRGVPTRVVSGFVGDTLWSADGRALFYWHADESGAVKRIYQKDVDLAGEPRVLLESGYWAFPEGVTPDGKELIYITGFDPNDAVWSLPLEGGEPAQLLQVDYALDRTVISPDGRWMAYAAQETGEWAVYVRPFRREGERKRVSPKSGCQPTWRGDGRELFYLTRQGQLMAVEVEEKGGRLEVGLPTALFDAGVSDPAFNQYTVTRDGQRFLVIRSVPGARFLRVTLNWPSLLEQ
jgi:Tol biopolymer transport system component